MNSGSIVQKPCKNCHDLFVAPVSADEVSPLVLAILAMPLWVVVHDSNAVAVYFHDDQLGYVPRVENMAMAQMLDRGERLEARISELMAEDAWEQVRFTVSLS